MVHNAVVSGNSDRNWTRILETDKRKGLLTMRLSMKMFAIAALALALTAGPGLAQTPGTAKPTLGQTPGTVKRAG